MAVWIKNRKVITRCPSFYRIKDHVIKPYYVSPSPRFFGSDQRYFTSATNVSSTSNNDICSRGSNIFKNYEELTMDRIISSRHGGIIDEYQSIDVDSVITEDYLQRLVDDHINHTRNSNTNNNNNNNNSNNNIVNKNNPNPNPPNRMNPNMLLNMLEMLRNDKADISNGTIEKIFQQVVQSKRVKLLERAEEVVVKNKYDPRLLTLLVTGYVNAGVPQRACKLLMEWPNESKHHQPGIKSYRVVLTALSSLSFSDPKHQQRQRSLSRNNQNHTNESIDSKDPQYVEQIDEENSYRLGHRLLMYMSRNHAKFPELSLKPDRDCFHRVLSACTTLDSLSTARQILDAMICFASGRSVKDTTIIPSTEMDHERKISNEYDSSIKVPDRLETLPNISTARLLVKGWTNFSTDNYDKDSRKEIIQIQKEAFSFLRRMEEQTFMFRQQDSSQSLDDSCVVDIQCYNVILNVVAKFGQYKLAESMFRRLLIDFLKGKSDIQPDYITINTVLKSHVQANTESAAGAAEQFLQRLEDLYNQQEKIRKRNVYKSTSVSTSNNFGNNRGGDAVDNSHTTSRLLEDIQPVARARTTILNMWAKLGRPHEAIKTLTEAEIIYRNKMHLISDATNGINDDIERFRPDKISYHQIIGALSKLKNPPTVAVAEEAEKIATRMIMMCHSMNLVTCNTILNCWTKSGNPNRAEAFLKEVIRDCNVRPDIISYNTIINGYSKLGNLSRSLEILAGLLNDDLPLHETDDILPKPNSRTFTSILTALSKEKTVEAAEEAENILLQMQELHDSPHNLDTRPNIITYNAVMKCWASVSFSSCHSKKSKQLRNNIYGRKAEFILKSMHGLDGDERPNEISYNTVVRAYSDDMNKAEELFQDMVARYEIQPTESTYNTLVQVLKRDDKIKDKKRKMTQLRDQYFPSPSFTSKSNIGHLNNAWNNDSKKGTNGNRQNYRTKRRNISSYSRSSYQQQQ